MRWEKKRQVFLVINGGTQYCLVQSSSTLTSADCSTSDVMLGEDQMLQRTKTRDWDLARKKTIVGHTIALLGYPNFCITYSSFLSISSKARQLADTLACFASQLRRYFSREHDIRNH